MWLAWVLVLISLFSCSSNPQQIPGRRVAVLGTVPLRAAPPAPAEAACADPVPVYAHGRQVQLLCRDAAAAAGLTVIDLSDGWTPRLLLDSPYRETYLALASERFGTGPQWDQARDDRYLELYGISPSFTVLRGRLLDEARHRCHDRAGSVRAHLRCEGLRRLEVYQRKQMIVAFGGLDAATRQALATDDRELDFRALLRALRERVVDATGLIEDGSALGAWGTVLGRDLDAAAFHQSARPGPLPDGAPDLISPATEAAAIALGWTSPQAAAGFFRTRQEAALASMQVAVRLPGPPAYHGAKLELRAVIDRGDVWYDYPYTASGRKRPQPVEHRPLFMLYGRDGEHERALVRWSTTIGGWQPERLPSGELRLRYKNSDVGPRVWRDLIATPAWLPPESTPEKEMVRRRQGGGWEVKEELFQSGYRSAYGLVMAMHQGIEVPPDGGQPVYTDDMIRTHGSVNYGSILHGYTHGCHRLFNHLAVRLGGFLLAHHPLERHGVLHTDYDRRFRYRGRPFDLRIAERGYRYELVPPVPVEVLPGRILGQATQPIRRPMPLPPGYQLR